MPEHDDDCFTGGAPPLRRWVGYGLMGLVGGLILLAVVMLRRF